jgi:hypothetical protein
MGFPLRLGLVALACAAFGGSVVAGSAETRWSDWVELFAPHAVLLPAGAALYAAAVPRFVWFWYVAGALMYVAGSGLLFATETIDGIPSGWLDEDLIRHLLHAGVAVVFASLAAVFRRRDRPGDPAGLAAYVLVLVGGYLPALVTIAALGFGLP